MNTSDKYKEKGTKGGTRSNPEDELGTENSTIPKKTMLKGYHKYQPYHCAMLTNETNQETVY